jgi:hypothetical protein
MRIDRGLAMRESAGGAPPEHTSMRRSTLDVSSLLGACRSTNKTKNLSFVVVIVA